MHRSCQISMGIWPLGLLLAAVLGLAGCEGGSDSDKSEADQYFKDHPYESTERDPTQPPVIEVTPSIQIVTRIGQEVVFTARGGDGVYRWSLLDYAAGSLLSHGANQALYTCLQLKANDIRIEDNSGHFGLARITSDQTTQEVAMAISPSSITLSGGSQQASFIVNGGMAPYTWSVANASLGIITYSVGTSWQASYTAVAGAYGQNIITVVDSAGRRTSATVTQSQ